MPSSTVRTSKRKVLGAGRSLVLPRVRSPPPAAPSGASEARDTPERSPRSSLNRSLIPMPDRFLVNGNYVGKEPAVLPNPEPTIDPDFIEIKSDEAARVYQSAGSKGLMKAYCPQQLRKIISEEKLHKFFNREEMIGMGMEDILEGEKRKKREKDAADKIAASEIKDFVEEGAKQETGEMDEWERLEVEEWKLLYQDSEYEPVDGDFLEGFWEAT